MSQPQTELGMLRRAKQRGPVWYQLDCGKEIIATLVCWHDRKCRIELLSGRKRTVETSRIRPA